MKRVEGRREVGTRGMEGQRDDGTGMEGGEGRGGEGDKDRGQEEGRSRREKEGEGGRRREKEGEGGASNTYHLSVDDIRDTIHETIST
jgi:hypothetical protein